MEAFSVVVVEPGCKCCRLFVVAGEDLVVGSFGGEGAIEAFDLAVGPGAERFNEALFGPEACDGFLECGGVSVGESVVGEDPFDLRDPVLRAEFRHPDQHAGGGYAFLVGVDLDVGESAVVVDHGVNIVEPDPFPAGSMVAAALFRVGPPAAAVRDGAEIFHVNVQEFAGSFSCVAVGCGPGGAELLPG